MRLWLFLDLVAANFTQALLDARAEYPYDILDLFVCPMPNCEYSWQLMFTQEYRHSQCLDLIPNGQTQFIIDMDHQCRYEERNQELDFGCSEMQYITPIEILGFSDCVGASAKNVFIEECGWVCKHNRPVSRCIYTVDPYGYYDLGDTLDGCFVDALCLCEDATLTTCNQEARFIQCYRTEEAVARLEAQADLDQTLQDQGGTHSLETLQAAYVEQQQELNALEDENEDVSDQLTTALGELQSSRDEHRAAISRHSTTSLESEATLDQAIINEKRLSSVETALNDEIKKREQKEKELVEEKQKNSYLWLAFTLVFIAAIVATGLALYFKKLKPRVVLVQGGGGGGEQGGEGPNVAVSNSTVVMGRAIPTESAKESSNVDLQDNSDRKGNGTSTLDVAA
jgi:hypothetical protein